MVALTRALVGILHVGEPSLAQAIASVESQERVTSTVHLIGHRPKWDAHRELFEHFSTAGRDYGLLVKLDADMELLHPRLLAASGEILARHRRVDHLVFGVDDWLSGERIMGMSIWRGGVRWEAPPPDLFTDLAPSSARDRLKLMDLGRPLVAHAQSPSASQAFRYGAHRALKAARTGKASRLDRLESFVRFTVTDPHPTRVLALAAVEAALLDVAFGRRLVDGLETITGDDESRLRDRALQLDELQRSVITHIDGLRSRSTSGVQAPPARVGPAARVRDSVRRRLSPPPLDAQRLREEFVASLDAPSD
jgi:hypothetical protein